VAAHSSCPACQEAVLEHDWFCPSCGAPVDPACAAKWVSPNMEPTRPAPPDEPMAVGTPEPAFDFIPLPPPEPATPRGHGHRWTRYGVMIGLTLVVIMGVLIIADPPLSSDSSATVSGPSHASAEVSAAGTVVSSSFDPARWTMISASATVGVQALESRAAIAHHREDDRIAAPIDDRVSTFPTGSNANLSGDGTAGVMMVERGPGLDPTGWASYHWWGLEP